MSLWLQAVTNCPSCRKILEQPQRLKCLHSYCRACLENIPKTDHDGHNGWQCKVCGIFTKEDKITEDILLEKVISVEHEAKKKVHTCQVCKKKRKELVYCTNCRMVICGACKNRHEMLPSNGSHMYKSLEQIMKGQVDDSYNCEKHPGDNKKEIYCGTCEELLCIICQKDHGNHKLLTIDTALNELRAQTDNCIENIKPKLETAYEQVEVIDKEIENVKRAYATWRKDSEDKLYILFEKLKTQKAMNDELVKQEESRILDKLAIARTKAHNEAERYRIVSNLAYLTNTKTKNQSQLMALKCGLLDQAKELVQEEIYKEEIEVPIPYIDDSDYHYDDKELMQILRPIKYQMKTKVIDENGALSLKSTVKDISSIPNKPTSLLEHHQSQDGDENKHNCNDNSDRCVYKQQLTNKTTKLNEQAKRKKKIYRYLTAEIKVPEKQQTSFKIDFKRAISEINPAEIESAKQTLKHINDEINPTEIECINRTLKHIDDETKIEDVNKGHPAIPPKPKYVIVDKDQTNGKTHVASVKFKCAKPIVKAATSESSENEDKERVSLEYLPKHCNDNIQWQENVQSLNIPGTSEELQTNEESIINEQTDRSRETKILMTFDIKADDILDGELKVADEKTKFTNNEDTSCTNNDTITCGQHLCSDWYQYLQQKFTIMQTVELSDMCSKVNVLGDSLYIGISQNDTIEQYNTSGELVNTYHNVHSTKVVKQTYNGCIVTGGSGGMYVTDKDFTEWTLLQEGCFCDIAIHGNKISALEYKQCKVITFEQCYSNGQYEWNMVSSFIMAIEHLSHWSRALATLTVDRESNVVICNYNTLLVYSNNGEYVNTIVLPERLYMITGMDGKGNIILSDFWTNRLYCINKIDEFDTNQMDQYFVCEKNEYTRDIAVDSEGSLWILHGREPYFLTKYKQDD